MIANLQMVYEVSDTRIRNIAYQTLYTCDWVMFPSLDVSNMSARGLTECPVVHRTRLVKSAGPPITHIAAILTDYRAVPRGFCTGQPEKCNSAFCYIETHAYRIRRPGRPTC